LKTDVPPSPKFQLKVNGPTPPVVVAVNVTAEAASGLPGVKLKLTAGAEATEMACCEVVVCGGFSVEKASQV